MLITLINPPILMSKKNAATVSPSLPLGLAYIAASISKDYEVKVIDAIGEAIEQIVNIKDEDYFFWGLDIKEIIERIDPSTKIVGITCMFTSNWPLHREIIRMIQEKFPQMIIALGGEHATCDHENIIKRSSRSPRSS